MLKDWKRRQQLKKVCPGDGSTLKDFQFYHLLTRSQFSMHAVDGDKTPHEYSVVVRYFADYIDASEEKKSPRSKKLPAAPVSVYRDQVQVYRSNSPAAFEVPGGFIEVGIGTYGLTRMHYVPSDGPEKILKPDPKTMEGWRAKMAAIFPRASKTFGLMAILILLVGLVVGIPQMVEIISRIDVVADHVGPFTSPIKLPSWADQTLLIACSIAGFERALTLRSHWLIDLDTSWTSFS